MPETERTPEELQALADQAALRRLVAMRVPDTCELCGTPDGVWRFAPIVPGATLRAPRPLCDACTETLKRPPATAA